MSAAPANEHEVYRALFQAYPDVVQLADAQGCIVLANTELCTLLGYTPQALVGQSVDTLVPLGVAPRHAAYRHGYALAPRTRPMGTELELMARCADGPGELLRRVPGTGAQALNADAVAVFLLTPNQLELHVETSAGLSEASFAHATQPSRPDTAMGWVVAQSVPLIVSAFELEQRVEVGACQRAARRLRRSWCCPRWPPTSRNAAGRTCAPWWPRCGRWGWR